MKKNNVIVISSEYPPHFVGGVGVLTRNLAVGLQKREMNVLVLTKGKKEKCISQAGVKVAVIESDGEIYIKDKSRAYQQRMKFIRSSKKYLNGIYNFIILMDIFLFPEAYVLSKMLKVPLISFFNQNFEEIFRSEGEDTYWVSDEYCVDSENAYYLEKECLKKSFASLFVSDSLKKEMERLYWKGENLYAIPLGIDTAELDNNSDESIIRNKGIVHIACAGRLSKIKNFDTVIEAAKLVLNQTDGVQFHIYGKGKEKESLLCKLKELGLEEKVSIEYYYNRDVIDHIRLCDIAIVPSLYETFGLTLFEFMYLKKPVICSNIDVFKELIGFSDSVLMMKNNKDSEEMAEKILLLIQNKELRQTLGKKAYDHICKYYTKECFADRMETILCELERKKATEYYNAVMK